MNPSCICTGLSLNLCRTAGVSWPGAHSAIYPARMCAKEQMPVKSKHFDRTCCAVLPPAKSVTRPEQPPITCSANLQRTFGSLVRSSGEHLVT